MKEWAVRYRVTYEGTTTVEAETAQEAWDKVEAGDFEDHPGQERTDWGAAGSVAGVREE